MLARMNAAKSGCGARGLDLNSGMELAANEPGMVRNLDDLDVNAFGRAPGDAEPGIG